MTMIREIHLFAGIGGGIYGGMLLGHRCIAGVEIDPFCQQVLKQRQEDGWLEKFPVFGDIKEVNGEAFVGQFDVLCGGFPCQAFSTAAHGQNKPEKNLWNAMRDFVRDSQAPIVFGENVTYKAINKARQDLIDDGYEVQVCKLSCDNIGADHQRNRYWLLAYNDKIVFDKLVKHTVFQDRISADNWTHSPKEYDYPNSSIMFRRQIKAVGNAQSPFAAATALRVLINRHRAIEVNFPIPAQRDEIEEVFNIQPTWIKANFGADYGLLHTPTTIANYLTPSMQKHPSCRKYKEVFGRLHPQDAEYLMGFPIGASYPGKIGCPIPEPWGEFHN